jgi:hypothetical protein
MYIDSIESNCAFVNWRNKDGNDDKRKIRAMGNRQQLQIRSFARL